MLYRLSHIVKDKIPFIWDIVEIINEKLFMLRYGNQLKKGITCLSKYQNEYRIRTATIDDVQSIVDFFSRQPENAYTYFKPHKFDKKSIRKLVKNKSFLIFLVFDADKLVGYYFLRCFFIGKSFLGKMVDYKYQGKGIGKTMCLSAMDVASTTGLRMFETISKENISSLYSTQKVLDTKIIEEMDNNYIYIKDFPKGTLSN